MLNRAIGGAFGFGTDIGGYFDIGPYPPTSKELFLRWAEWAALTPVFRLHGSVSAGVHAPWTYDQQTVDVYNALSGLHLSAEPLIRRLWREADRDGVPPTEPLYLAFHLMRAPPRRTRNGFSVPMCSWRPSSCRARPPARSTSRVAVGAAPPRARW